MNSYVVYNDLLDVVMLLCSKNAVGITITHL